MHQTPTIQGGRPSDSGSVRRHDLDALRAFAMLLGISLHASLSFFPAPWPVQDSRQSSGFAIFMDAVHGFRMPLFFLLSGYFTMMMYRSRGLSSLLRQRALRILFPCLVGVLTVVPLMSVVSVWAMSSRQQIDDVQEPLVRAIRSGNVSAIQNSLQQGADLDRADARFKIRPLHWASLVGNLQVVSLLIEQGADVNQANDDGNTPMHAAAFLGHEDVLALLLKHGANSNARNREGKTPISAVDASEDITKAIVTFLGLPVPETSKLAEGRSQVRDALKTTVASIEPTLVQSAKQVGWLDQTVADYSAFMNSKAFQVYVVGYSFHLVNTRVFDHLWFLWFLCWAVGMFSIAQWLAKSLGREDSCTTSDAPAWGLYLLIPATMVPQLFMGAAFPHFGPDTSTGILPQPHLLVYYSLFFGFGALYFNVSDTQGVLGRRWWLLLPLGLFIVFPVGLATIGQRPLAMVIQPTYTWIMSIGMMGLFHATLNRPSSLLRYLSDASYWLYLTHLPLVIALQAIVRPWPYPAILKFAVVNFATLFLLLVTYHLCVRYTWIGLVLNGRRHKSGNPCCAAVSADSPGNCSSMDGRLASAKTSGVSTP